MSFHFHDERCYAVGPGDTEVLVCKERGLVDHLERQKAFSERVFGPGPRTKGVLDHIRKELMEIEAKPDDLGEWIDVVILAFDGAWRAGYTPEEIVEALVAKQVRNEARRWPDWRTAPPDTAIEHVRTEEVCLGCGKPTADRDCGCPAGTGLRKKDKPTRGRIVPSDWHGPSEDF